MVKSSLKSKINISYIKFSFYLSLLFFLRIDLVFVNNTPTGGDMGAHVVAVDYFVSNLFPQFKIMGWTNMWFAGIPLFYFYFPFPPFLVSLLTIFFPFGIAFKMMVVGSIILVVYGFDKLFRETDELFSFSGFICGVAFVLTESFTIYGGNLASTLAGQYSFTYSMGFGLLAYTYVSKDKSNRTYIWSSFFFAMCLLSHLIPFLIFSLITVFKLVTGNFLFLEKINFFVISLGLSAIWFIPMLFNLGYTTDMGYTPFTKIRDLIKEDIYPLIFLCLFFIIFFYKEMASEKEIFQIALYMLTTASLLFFYIPPGALWNGRLVPFFNLGLLILFGLVLKIIFRRIDSSHSYLSKFIALLSFSIFPLGYNYFTLWAEKYQLSNFLLLSIFLFTFIILFISKSNSSLAAIVLYLGILSSVSFLPHWINWNFTGYESKENWQEIVSLYDNLNNLPPGRITWEANPDLNEYGTPMVLMTIPMFTEHTSMEGLYFDSSITTPFHFISVSGLSEKPSNPVGGLRYFNDDFERGVYYLRELGVDYYITNTDKLYEIALSSRDLIFINKVNRFGIFEVKDSYKVIPAIKQLEEVRISQGINNILTSLFRQRENKFQEFSLNNFYNLNSKKHFVELSKVDEDLAYLNELLLKEEITQSGISSLLIRDNKISFNTQHVGRPHIIKVSYFPNWELNNGYGPYKVDPSFMLIIPLSSNVELNFKTSKIEVASKILFFLAIIISIFLNTLIKRISDNV